MSLHMFFMHFQEVLPMTIINNFITHYKKEYDYYEMVSKLVAQKIETVLHESGIRAIVTYRAKNPERLLTKLQQRNEERDIKYSCLEDIYSDICDLSGVRVALYFPSDRNKVDTIIKDSFQLLSNPKVFPSNAKTPTYEKRFSGYWAKHYRVKLKENTLSDSQQRYALAKTEIQVASVLMHAWSEVEHDLVYKPLNGNLSNEELAILDELNGLVLAGEIALERLQAAGASRIAKEKLFNNQYELASFLYSKYEDKFAKNSAFQLGNVELLFKLMNECNLKSSTDLSPYLKSLFFTSETRSLCEQIADHIIMGDETRYNTYSFLKSSFTNNDIELQSAIGCFMEQWINLERALARFTSDKNPKSRAIFSPNNLRHFFSEKDVYHILELRKSRNLIVHGIELPPINEINLMTTDIQGICSKLLSSSQ